MKADVPEISALAIKIHETAKAKGFWDVDRNRGEMFMLVSSELAEALEEHRNGKDPFYFEDESPKPEGATVELADAVIRCLDTLASLYNGSVGSLIERSRRLQSHGGGMYRLTDNFGENLLSITAILIRARINVSWLADVIVMCERLAYTLEGPDLWDVIDIKMAYNDTRPYKHGKAY
jgi:hypothetical protein